MNREQSIELIELVDLSVDVNNISEDELENATYDAVRIFHIKKKYWSAGIRIMWENYLQLEG